MFQIPIVYLWRCVNALFNETLCAVVCQIKYKWFRYRKNLRFRYRCKLDSGTFSTQSPKLIAVLNNTFSKLLILYVIEFPQIIDGLFWRYPLSIYYIPLGRVLIVCAKPVCAETKMNAIHLRRYSCRPVSFDWWYSRIVIIFISRINRSIIFTREYNSPSTTLDQCVVCIGHNIGTEYIIYWGIIP